MSIRDEYWFTSRYFGFAASKNANAWLQEEFYSFVSEKYGLIYIYIYIDRDRERATSFSKEMPTIQLQQRRGRWDTDRWTRKEFGKNEGNRGWGWMMPLCRRASVNRPPTPDVSNDKESEPTLQEIINVKVEKTRQLIAEVSVFFIFISDRRPCYGF